MCQDLFNHRFQRKDLSEIVIKKCLSLLTKQKMKEIIVINEKKKRNYMVTITSLQLSSYEKCFQGLKQSLRYVRCI